MSDPMHGVLSDGTQCWFMGDISSPHREDGPAIIWPSGIKMWYQYGLRHRIDGAATEYPDGRQEYWYRGKYIPVNNLKEFRSYIRMKAFW